jgi:hypothetical protein
MVAFRALAGEPPEAVAAALGRAASQVPPAYEEARQLAEGFAARVAKGFQELGGEPSQPAP